MCIGGAGVAIGYVGAPELTTERFVADPFVSGGRLYRTGDRARYLDDGTLVLLGRMDRQVKLRGFRIELGDIEAALQRQPAIAAGAVDFISTGDDRRLVAWVVTAAGPIDVDALRTALRARLPDYMVPSWFVELEALPMTPNGKVDRRHLPVPQNGNRLTPIRTEPDRPVGPIEAVLARVVSDGAGHYARGCVRQFFLTWADIRYSPRNLFRVYATCSISSCRCEYCSKIPPFPGWPRPSDGRPVRRRRLCKWCRSAKTARHRFP